MTVIDIAAPNPSDDDFCDYVSGMRANEPTDDMGNDERLDVVSFHEAGHAVVQFALGLGCCFIRLHIWVDTKDSKQPWEFGGASKMDSAAVGRAKGQVSAKGFDVGTCKLGMSAAAGAASEWKWSRLKEYPLNTLISAKNDRAKIEGAAARFNSRGLDGVAYRNSVWRQAQIAISRGEIWSAIRRVVYHLGALPSRQYGNHTTVVMEGEVAISIMRQAGVESGSLTWNG